MQPKFGRQEVGGNCSLCGYAARQNFFPLFRHVRLPFDSCLLVVFLILCSSFTRLFLLCLRSLLLIFSLPFFFLLLIPPSPNNTSGRRKKKDYRLSSFYFLLLVPEILLCEPCPRQILQRGDPRRLTSRLPVQWERRASARSLSWDTVDLRCV